MSSVGSGERPGSRPAVESDRSTRAEGPCSPNQLDLRNSAGGGSQGPGLFLAGVFQPLVQTPHLPPCRGGRWGVGRAGGWTEGLRPAGSGAGQAWARVRREVVREAGFGRPGRPGSRGHPPFWKTQPEVVGSAAFHLTRLQHPPSGPRAVPVLGTGPGPGFLPAAAFPKRSRRLLPATCTFLLKRQKNLPDLKIVFTPSHFQCIIYVFAAPSEAPGLELSLASRGLPLAGRKVSQSKGSASAARFCVMKRA